MTGLVQSLPLSRPRETVPMVREGLLAAFFIALAFSISVSQALLALLVLLAVPWTRLSRGLSAGHTLGELRRAVWVEAEPLRRHPLTPPVLVFIGLTIMSAAVSGNAGWSLWTARDTLRVLALYVVLVYTRDATHALQLWKGFLAALTLMAGYGLSQAYLCGGRPSFLPESWLAELCTHATRVRGPFSIYMTFGGVLLLGALFFIAYLANVPWRQGPRGGDAWWMVPGAALTVAALAFTYSRNAWLGLAAGTMALVVTARRTLRVALVLLCVALLGTTLSSGAVMSRVRSIVNPQDATIRDRVAMWRSGLAMVADHPILGVGPGQVRVWYQQYRRPEAVRPSTGHLHNSAIHLAAERGLPALAAWVWFWIAFLREGVRVLARLGPGRSRQRALVSASLGGTAGFLVAGLFEHNFGDAEVVMLVYALMALPFIVQRDLPATRPAALVPGP